MLLYRGFHGKTRITHNKVPLNSYEDRLIRLCSHFGCAESLSKFGQNVVHHNSNHSVLRLFLSKYALFLQQACSCLCLFQQLPRPVRTSHQRDFLNPVHPSIWVTMSVKYGDHINGFIFEEIAHNVGESFYECETCRLMYNSMEFRCSSNTRKDFINKTLSTHSRNS